MFSKVIAKTISLLSLTHLVCNVLLGIAGQFCVQEKNSLQLNKILSHDILYTCRHLNLKILESAAITINTHLHTCKKGNNIILARQYQHMATDTHIVKVDAHHP